MKDKDKKDMKTEDIENFENINDQSEEKNRVKWNGLVKKARRKTVLRTLGISMLAILILFVVASLISNTVVNEMRGKQEIATRDFNTISAPNRYLGKDSRYEDFFKGHTEVSTYKLIGGKVVPTEPFTYSYGLFQDYRGDWTGSTWPQILSQSYDEEDAKQVRYNELGQREMIFYYPYIEYNSYRDDFEILEELEENQLVEVALSLDGYYSIAQIQELFPKDLIAWYWLDDMSDTAKEDAKSHISIQETSDGDITHLMHNRVRSERTAYGVKAYSENGQVYDEPLKYFNWALVGSSGGTRFHSEFERIYYEVCNGKELTEEDECFGGLIVSGPAEEVLSLIDYPQIKASALGVLTSSY